jgi:hypothetical protein
MPFSTSGQAGDLYPKRVRQDLVRQKDRADAIVSQSFRPVSAGNWGGDTPAREIGGPSHRVLSGTFISPRTGQPVIPVTKAGEAEGAAIARVRSRHGL